MIEGVLVSWFWIVSKREVMVEGERIIISEE